MFVKFSALVETGSTSYVQEEVDHINESSDENLETNIVQADDCYGSIWFNIIA